MAINSKYVMGVKSVSNHRYVVLYASLNLQEHLHIIEKWLKKWKIKVNESKSSHIKFTLRKDHCPAVNINQTIIPQTEVVKYFDCRLNWKEHIVKKENKST
jgi:hypothetical protein